MVSLRLKKIILIFGDIAIFYLSLFLILAGQFYFSTKFFISHLLSFSILLPSWIVLFYIFGLYEFSIFSRRLFFLFLTLASLFFVFLFSSIFFYFLSTFFAISPKKNLLFLILVFFFLFSLWRRLFNLLFLKKLKRKILLVGESLRMKELENEISNRDYLGYCPQRVSLEEIKDLDIRNFETVIFQNGLEKERRFQKIFFEGIKNEIGFLHERVAFETFAEKVFIQDLSFSWFLENVRVEEKFFYEKMKRILDILFASIFLITTLPLWLLFAFLIFLEDQGPIFLRQKRVGKNGKIFYLLKFRSMTEDAEKEGAVWAEEEDKRITKVGRFLRESHLDELPQLINILKGEISLVGPRPERPEFVGLLEKEIPFYFLRHIVKPGFTGWAQIKFRYARSIQDSLEKFQYDLYYIKNRSLFLDLKILLQTFRLLLSKNF